MPRRETPFLPGLYYHVYNRGNNRQSIFFQPENYLYFLRNVRRYLAPVVHVIVYCLMPTHYHMLLRIKTSAISNAMMRLSVSYTKAINKRFERVGSLFQGQFRADPVQTYSHLLNLCVYIHGNPVKDKLVAFPEDWIYSNYLEWIGQRNGTLIDQEFMLENFGSSAEYKVRVTDYLKTRRLSEDMESYLQSFE